MSTPRRLTILPVGGIALFAIGAIAANTADADAGATIATIGILIFWLGIALILIYALVRFVVWAARNDKSPRRSGGSQERHLS